MILSHEWKVFDRSFGVHYAARARIIYYYLKWEPGPGKAYKYSCIPPESYSRYTIQLVYL
jgi:hypothetical protein